MGSGLEKKALMRLQGAGEGAVRDLPQVLVRR
jgi:hypothetical protein